MLSIRCSYPLPGMPPGAEYRVLRTDACHFYVTPARFEGPEFRVPLRNLYVTAMVLEPQEHLQMIMESL